eukprot:scaffold44984_cov28-Tisochrysis_lutea.AAC.2
MAVRRESMRRCESFKRSANIRAGSLNTCTGPQAAAATVRGSSHVTEEKLRMLPASTSGARHSSTEALAKPVLLVRSVTLPESTSSGEWSD